MNSTIERNKKAAEIVQTYIENSKKNYFSPEKLEIYKEEILLLKDLINDSFVNPKLILEVFQDLNNDEDVLIYSPKKMKGEVHKKLKFELISFINNEAFIPVYGNGFCSPTSLYSWKYKLIDCFYL